MIRIVRAVVWGYKSPTRYVYRDGIWSPSNVVEIVAVADPRNLPETRYTSFFEGDIDFRGIYRRSLVVDVDYNGKRFVGELRDYRDILTFGWVCTDMEHCFNEFGVVPFYLIPNREDIFMMKFGGQYYSPNGSPWRIEITIYDSANPMERDSISFTIKPRLVTPYIRWRLRGDEWD